MKDRQTMWTSARNRIVRRYPPPASGQPAFRQGARTVTLSLTLSPVVAGLVFGLGAASAADRPQAETEAGTKTETKAGTRTAPKTAPKAGTRAAATPRKGPAQDAAKAKEERILVTGRKSPTVASSGTKTDTPLVDTPQSVTVIDRHEMDIRGVLSLSQAVRYTAGITPDQRGSTATRYDLFALRGFTIPNFLDGLKLQDSPTGYATAQIDTSRLDRIEILKGPASALYGQSSPGGLVAMSSKLPTSATSYGSLVATGGSFDLYRVDGDVGGALTGNGFVRYRLYGTANGSHSQLSQTQSRRYSISPAVTFGGDGDTTLTLLGNVQDDPQNASYGSVPLEGSLKRAAFGYIRQNFYDGDPNFEEFNRRQWATTYIFNHRFNADWAFSSRGRHDDVKTVYESVYSEGVYLDPDYERDYAQEALGNFSRGTAYAREHLRNLAFDNQLTGHFSTGPLRHAIMLGFDYQESEATELDGFGSAPSINVLHPVYRQQITPPAISNNYLTDQHQIGVYAQDQVDLGNLHLTGSLRNDWYRSHQQDTIGGSYSSQNPEMITWRAAGLYHFKFGLAPYISYSTSFQPQSGVVSSNGGQSTRQADPTVGKQLEGGFKYQIPGLPILLTAAGFHIEQTNVLVAVPNSNYSTESGKVRSDGFEFEAHVNVYKGLTVVATANTQKVRDLSTGKPLIQVGKGGETLFGYYTMPSGRLKGLGFGGGLRHVDSAFGGTASYGDITVPSYTLFDASASYDLANLGHAFIGWKVQASVRNLFNKRYVASCYGYAPYDEWCWYGERRTAQASLGFSW
ncbi:TonB-dependent siderophore receptor [Gluconacetobacter diazotrophicus]|uniref:Putative TonB-dependent receptor n=1 Tax=Gluconacetobacter diazotrophicus (strain ATCC 49037 / DSM 5601 / CCUG 37298 / CIP 103539 / LMG 7603 / PAl5) TaxID=272568 RepID=A9H7L3_GLUDA|nr:TonB-dependent siderophore receptor [Gluconacetobacter diazotrophicus]CAP57656.1 putative TonB-dependent receptor [Gluconacetobacter diazotrophicus PA1 5]